MTTNASNSKPSRSYRLIFLIGLCLYLVQGIKTELQLIVYKPVPLSLLEDYRFYERALTDTNKGMDPYAVRSIGPGFLYPPTALLIVEIIHYINPFSVKYTAYLILTSAMMMCIVFGVARQYGYSSKNVWYWYILCLGFAPFLELLHIGQINVITLFGIFLLFCMLDSSTVLSGFGLSLAILTKVSPVVFLVYLATTKKIKGIVSCFVWIILMMGVTIVRYGISPVLVYPSMFQWLADQFPVGPNSQSLVAKLITVVGLDLSHSEIHLSQMILMLYITSIIVVSAVLTRRGNQPREPLFLVSAFGITIMPNVMWYHHYVFILLPILIWMAWMRLHPHVVLWCLLGMILIQTDRFYLTEGLLIHIFMQMSIIAIVIWQARQFLLSIDVRDRLPIGESPRIPSTTHD
jgi:hypothetical protein